MQTHSALGGGKLRRMRRMFAADGRAVLVHITENGRDVGRSRHQDRGRHLSPLIAELTPMERRALAAALPVLARLAELGAAQADQ